MFGASSHSSPALLAFAIVIGVLLASFVFLAFSFLPSTQLIDNDPHLPLPPHDTAPLNTTHVRNRPSPSDDHVVGRVIGSDGHPQSEVTINGLLLTEVAHKAANVQLLSSAVQISNAMTDEQGVFSFVVSSTQKMAIYPAHGQYSEIASRLPYAIASSGSSIVFVASPRYPLHILLRDEISSVTAAGHLFFISSDTQSHSLLHPISAESTVQLTAGVHRIVGYGAHGVETVPRTIIVDAATTLILDRMPGTLVRGCVDFAPSEVPTTIYMSFVQSDSMEVGQPYIAALGRKVETGPDGGFEIPLDPTAGDYLGVAYGRTARYGTLAWFTTEDLVTVGHVELSLGVPDPIHGLFVHLRGSLPTVPISAFLIRNGEIQRPQLETILLGDRELFIPSVLAYRHNQGTGDVMNIDTHELNLRIGEFSKTIDLDSRDTEVEVELPALADVWFVVDSGSALHEGYFVELVDAIDGSTRAFLNLKDGHGGCRGIAYGSYRLSWRAGEFWCAQDEIEISERTATFRNIVPIVSRQQYKCVDTRAQFAYFVSRGPGEPVGVLKPVWDGQGSVLVTPGEYEVTLLDRNKSIVSKSILRLPSGVVEKLPPDE